MKVLEIMKNSEITLKMKVLEIMKNSEITLKMKVGETFLVKKISNN
jgi:hypothetical protein